MALDFLGVLPAPKNIGEGNGDDVRNQSWYKNRVEELQRQGGGGASKFKEPPPYGRRAGFIPRKLEDFGDGGAFPEIHFPQFPLDMGRQDKKQLQLSTSVLPVTVDAEGQVRFDAIVKQGENARKIVYSQHRDLVPKLPTEIRPREDPDEAKETTERTQLALEKIVHERLAAAQPKNVPTNNSGASFIKYTPTNQLAAFNSGAKERTIKMVEMPVDPLEPPKHKHKRVPRASGSPPVPIMHSPPRPVTVKDQQDWKIPPCISNWKNPKGYTIPLDKRLAADGRGLQEVQINDSFAKLSEALYVAEQKAREAVEMRAKIQKEINLKEKDKKEQELRAVAAKVRMERATAREPGRIEEDREERAERLKREEIREERKRERERERRLEAKEAAGGKKSRITRDRDRDITEKVALGMANVKSGGEVMYDQRLFNQEQGMDSGYGNEDDYNVYEKPLFNAQSGLGGLYKPNKDGDSDVYGGNPDEQLEKLKTERFKPDKGFAGVTDRKGPRDRPVEFEKDVKVVASSDPFELEKFLTEVKTGKRGDRGGGGGGGTMRASGGSGTKESYEGGSSRSRVDFQRARR